MYKIVAITILLAVALLLSACSGESIPDEVYQVLAERDTPVLKDEVTDIHKAKSPENFRNGSRYGADEVWCVMRVDSDDTRDGFFVRRIGNDWRAIRVKNLVPGMWDQLVC